MSASTPENCWYSKYPPDPSRPLSLAGVEHTPPAVSLASRLIARCSWRRARLHPRCQKHMDILRAGLPAARPGPKLRRALWAIASPATRARPVDESCEERKSQGLIQNDQGRTTRSALISLPSVILVVAWRMNFPIERWEAEKQKRADVKERGKKRTYGSGAEDVGDR